MPQALNVIGLTGKLCSGKNLAAGYLKQEGYHIIDVDLLGHQVLEKQSREAAELFGDDMLTDGSVNRELLGRRVFSNPQLLDRLEKFLHPLMNEAVITEIEYRNRSSFSRGIVINAALLKKMQLDRLCSSVIFVTASRRTRLARARENRGMSRRAFRERDRSQKEITPESFAGRVSLMTVKNSGSRGEFIKQLDSLMIMMDSNV